MKNIEEALHMADKENNGITIFNVPDEPKFIRTPRKSLLGFAGAMALVLGALSGLSFGTSIGGLMLIFMAPLWMVVIFMIIKFLSVWHAYKYSRIMLLAIYLIVCIIVPLVMFILQRA